MKQTNILFVCKFNRFRSKFAAAYFNKVNQNEHLTAKSAGVFKWKPLGRELLDLARQSELQVSKETQGLNEELMLWQNMIVIVADNVPASIFLDNRINKSEVLVWKIDEKLSNLGEIKKRVDRLIKTLE